MDLTGWSSVSLRAGALLHLQRTVVTCGVRYSDVHLDVRDTKQHRENKTVEAAPLECDHVIYRYVSKFTRSISP